jgi:hypothetical protein
VRLAGGATGSVGYGMADQDLRATLIAVVRLQADACRRAGSPLYARILDGVARDVAGGGVCADLLGDDGEEPLASALALRFLGSLHRIVLEGRDPELARYYPSAGGTADGDPVPAFIAAVHRHRDEVAARLPNGVQTNEVGRATVLVGGFLEVARSTGLALRTLEVGASAGLNSRWDHYWYDTGRSTFGDPDSPVRFAGGVWEGEPPDLGVPAEVVDRRGCDRDPVDPGTGDGRLTLLSFVWPDQLDRIRRLEAALDIARRAPVPVDRAPAVDWLADALAVPAPGVATVVVHSIVLQYLSPEERRRVHELLRVAGTAAEPDAPLAWLRMEPAGEQAELRLTTWPDGRERLLATAGYHGRPVRWVAGEREVTV